MRKGPLIASIIIEIIGIIMIIIGSVFYDGILTNWNDWVLWFGIVFVAIGLIVLIVAFIKKPSEEGEKAKSSND